MGAALDRGQIEKAYARWAPVYDLVFGTVFAIVNVVSFTPILWGLAGPLTLFGVTVPKALKASRRSSAVVLNGRFPTYRFLLMIIPWGFHPL